MNLNHIISCRVYCFAYPRLVQRRFVSVPSRVNLKYVAYIPIGYYSTAIIVCKFLRLIQIRPVYLRPQACLFAELHIPFAQAPCTGLRRRLIFFRERSGFPHTPGESRRNFRFWYCAAHENVI